MGLALPFRLSLYGFTSSVNILRESRDSLAVKLDLHEVGRVRLGVDGNNRVGRDSHKARPFITRPDGHEGGLDPIGTADRSTVHYGIRVRMIPLTEQWGELLAVANSTKRRRTTTGTAARRWEGYQDRV